jgi:hypothetical protein
VAELDIGGSTAGFAVTDDASFLGNNKVGLGVLALSTKNKSVDEAVERVLELGSVVGSVDDVPVVGRLGSDLGSELETEVFNNI